MTTTTESLARHGIDVVDAGIAPAVRRLIDLLNAARWSSPMARDRGLRRLILAARGSRGVVDDAEFARRATRLVIQWSVPTALRAAAQCHEGAQRERMLQAAALCEHEPSRAHAMEARATYTDTYAASASGAARASTDTAARAAHAAADAASFAAHATSYIDKDGSATHIAGAALHAAAASAYAATKAASSYAAAVAYTKNVARDAAEARAAYDDMLAEFSERVAQVLAALGSPGAAYLS